MTSSNTTLKQIKLVGSMSVKRGAKGSVSIAQLAITEFVNCIGGRFGLI